MPDQTLSLDSLIGREFSHYQRKLLISFNRLLSMMSALAVKSGFLPRPFHNSFILEFHSCLPYHPGEPG
jgi:hypothetical protein